MATRGRTFPRGTASALQPIKGAPLPQRKEVGELGKELWNWGVLQVALDFHDPEGRAQESSW